MSTNTVAPATVTPIRRPDVISLNLKGKSSLYAAWMPFLKGGGLFMESRRPHKLGDEILLVLTFLDESTKIPLAGTVAWLNPPHAQGNRPQGVGIRLPDTEAGKELKKKIEGILAPVAKSDRPTHTL
ncbi:MAG: pilus assembly protein PilZ [Betaproteobacteria bacterium]|nr:pilus assembly protein PilZ [Betaproteobacteria bacterium]